MFQPGGRPRRPFRAVLSHRPMRRIARRLYFSAPGLSDREIVKLCKADGSAGSLCSNRTSILTDRNAARAETDNLPGCMPDASFTPFSAFGPAPGAADPLARRGPSFTSFAHLAG